MALKADLDKIIKEVKSLQAVICTHPHSRSTLPRTLSALAFRIQQFQNISCWSCRCQHVVAGNSRGVKLMSRKKSLARKKSLLSSEHAMLLADPNMIIRSSWSNLLPFRLLIPSTRQSRRLLTQLNPLPWRLSHRWQRSRNLLPLHQNRNNLSSPKSKFSMSNNCPLSAPFPHPT